MMNAAEISPLSVEQEEAYRRIRDWVHQRSGMIYPDSKMSLLAQRMQRVCEKRGIQNLDTLADSLEADADSDMAFEVLHAASTNHTYFFREPQVLDYFQQQILPTLPDEVRIWSAAASTGDEAYTIAMLAAESKGMSWTKNKLSILGTDISDVVIAHAEKAIYSGSHIDKMPVEILESYFDAVGLGQYRVKQVLRSICTFRRLNLKVSPYPFQRGFHVVFCRNVLYYFDVTQQKQVIEAIYNVTEPGGWLLTSVTVSLRNLDSRWIQVGCGLYRKPL